MISNYAALVESAADLLEHASATGTACDPVRGIIPTTLDAAYSVQESLTERALAAGRTIVGRKIGLTNVVVQKQLGVEQPDTGVLFDDMRIDNGGERPYRTLIAPRIEAEVAVILGSDLVGPDLTEEHVRAAVESVTVALEIVDSRIRNWDITIVDTVADNASSAGFVIGSDRVPLGEMDLSAVSMTLREESTVVSLGTGADCLGDPLAALLWLATAARDLGRPLRTGEIVLTGALGPMVPVTAGATYTSDVTGLGSVSVTLA